MAQSKDTVSTTRIKADSSQSFGFNNVNTQQNGKKSDALPIKLVIYDFDQTITCLHLYYELEGGQEDALKKMSDDKLLSVFGGEERTKRLTEHFERLSSNNIELAIISFGWVGVIKNALKRIKMYKFFEKSVIIGKDSEELKSAGSKANCIKKMKKKRQLKSAQIIFCDDDKSNTQKAESYCKAIAISPRCGMSYDHMKEIEELCKVYPMSMELTTPKTMSSEITKAYPSQLQNDKNSETKPKKVNKLEKYKIKEVPKWFDNLNKPANDTPVIQIPGDQTPGSESGEYELNVPMLNSELSDVSKKQKNGLSLNLNTSDNESEDDQKDEDDKQ